MIARLLKPMDQTTGGFSQLYVFEDLGAQETADRVNEEFPDRDTPMTVDNVHKIASRFRKDLRDELEGSG